MTENTQPNDHNPNSHDDQAENSQPDQDNNQDSGGAHAVENPMYEEGDDMAYRHETQSGENEQYESYADSMPEDGQHAGSDDARVQQLEEELAKTKDQLVRTLADAENLRKRTQRDRVDAGKYAVSAFAKDLLDFSDNFRRALDSTPEDLKELDERVANLLGGIEAMERDLLSTFGKHGIEKIEPMDEQFNPNFHEVMFEVDAGDKPAGTIIQVIEPGYMLHDRLLRPARVGVAKDNGGGATDAGQHIDQQA